MSRQFGIIVLVLGFAMGFAAATLLFRQGADESAPQSRGPSASVEKHSQYPESRPFSQQYASAANIEAEDSLAPAPISHVKGDESVRTLRQVPANEAIRYVWGDLIDELGLDTKRANELMKIYLHSNGTDRTARLREELGESGYQAYLDYLPTLPLRGELVPFKAELTQRGIPLDRETEKMLLQIIREEKPSGQQAAANNSPSQEQMRQRIYNRASGIFSGEALSLFKVWGEGRL